MILIDEYVVVDKGLNRELNEDNVYINGIILPEKNNGYRRNKIKTNNARKEIKYAIFDGIGGLEKGEHASYISSSILKKYNNKKSINEIISIINKKIYKYNKDNNIDTGTTSSIISIKNNKLMIYQIGDSPVYMLSRKKFSKIIEKKDKEKLLNNYLGNNLDIEMSTKEISLRHNDKIVLCSDGLSLDEYEIEYILSSSNDIKHIAEKLINYSLMSNGKDNISIIVLRVRNNITLQLVLISLLALIAIIIVYSI